MKFLKYLFIVFYSALFLYTVFFARRRRNMQYRYLNLYPLKKNIREFHFLNFSDTRDVLNYFSNLLGNLLLFLPFTFIMIILYSYRSSRRILLWVLLLSLLTEVMQYIFRVGVADIDDVLLNTVGGWAGIQFFLFLQKKYPRT